MILKDVCFSDPLDNILYDEVLLQLAERGESGEVLRLWESTKIFVVLGRTSSVTEDVDVAMARGDGVPILRRRSGGGTVVQGPGCLNFSLILSKERRGPIVDLRQSYRYILDHVARGLKTLGVETVFRPISDLALLPGEFKISGNAQHRGRKFILHHGTLLYDFDLSLISRYLKLPKDVPEYRRGRTHMDFVRNFSCPAAALRAALVQIFSAMVKSDPETDAVEREAVEQLRQEYSALGLLKNL
jgi:lipoate---protein ligase